MLAVVSEPGAAVERAIVFEQVSDYRRVSAHRCISSWSVLFADTLLEVDFGLRMVGPVLFVVLRFQADRFTPEVAAQFTELVEKGGGTEIALGELSKPERANFLARLEQCLHRRLRLPPEKVTPAFESMFAIVDRVSAQGKEPERRTTERYPVSAAVKLSVGDAPPVDTSMENLSLGGAFISMPMPAPFHAPVKVELHLPAGVVTSDATVVNVSDRGLGIQFNPAPEAAKKLVENLNAIAPTPAPPTTPLSMEQLLLPSLEPASPDAEPLPRLGDYELLSELGRGGRGEVYFARGVDGPRHGQYVALKRLNRRFSNDTAAAKELVVEAQTLALLDHPAIVKTLEEGVFDGHQCIVMEVLDGRDLGQLLRRARGQVFRLPVDCALYVAKTLLEALEAVHVATSRTGQALQLVHCDVSPHNLFISRAGQVKLGDFGSVRRSGERVRDVLAQGRPSYLSPEGLDGALSLQRDLWAAAVTTFELVTLELPFAGETIEELIANIRSSPPRSLRLMRAETTSALQAVLEKALSKDPSQRFHSAAEFAAALGAQLDPEKGSPAALAEVVKTLFAEKSWKTRSGS